METAIFRIVQECLTNVHRHSGSSTAAVRITNVVNQLRIEVRDAGKGIPSEKQSEMACAGKTGVGMRGMRERLRQFGGQLEVISVPGQNGGRRNASHRGSPSQVRGRSVTGVLLLGSRVRRRCSTQLVQYRLETRG